MHFKALILIAAGLFLSACAPTWWDLEKMSNAELSNTYRSWDDGRLCYYLDGWPVTSREAKRAYSIAVNEAEGRGLGDCSYAHQECTKLGLEYKTEKYMQCRIGMAGASNPTFSAISSPPASVKATPKSASPKAAPPSQAGSGSGFFVSRMGHVLTNAHVVKGCKRVTVGDAANKQSPVEVLSTDPRNDLALLKLASLNTASAETKSLINKLEVKLVPLAAGGLLRSEDVELGEKVMVAGYPYGDIFSNAIKVTRGIVSAVRGMGDDTGQFQMDAAVQSGNSGGPIYDENGNIVGVVVSQLNKLKMAEVMGSLPENVNFGIKASTVRQFLTSSGLPSKRSQRSKELSTQQLAKTAQSQALMVMCYR